MAESPYDEGLIRAFLRTKTCTTNLTDVDTTWREWIRDLLVEFQREAECFDGKRPFGNSGWEFELAKGLTIVDPLIGEDDDDPDYPSFEVDDWGRVENAWKAVVGYVLNLKT